MTRPLPDAADRAMRRLSHGATGHDVRDGVRRYSPQRSRRSLALWLAVFAVASAALGIAVLARL